ncbi:MAG: hypothetical protein ABIJ34_02440 [archaeon]
MIGKPEWFTYRVFGWGLRPRTWQGWAYIAVFVGLIMATTQIFAETMKAWLFAGLMAILIIDTVHMMMQLPKTHDERENYHQLLIERNASVAAVMAIAGIILYQSYRNQGLADLGMVPFDMSLFVVLGAMVVVKAASYAYIKLRM